MIMKALSIYQIKCTLKLYIRGTKNGVHSHFHASQS